MGYRGGDDRGPRHHDGRVRRPAILIVNTASRCGYTGQFDGLQRLHERFKDRGLAIIGFPCNQFMNQDPGSDKDIADFCVNYGVTFQMMSKIEVNGENRHPLYTFLTEESPEAMRGDIGWNFEKFLLRPDGVPVGRFASRVEPEDERIVSAIEAAPASVRCVVVCCGRYRTLARGV